MKGNQTSGEWRGPVAPNSNHYFRNVLIFLALASNVGCDQLSKKVVRESIGLHEEISLIPEFLTLTKVENTGAFLSLGDALPPSWKLLLLVGLPTLMLVFALLYLIASKELSMTKTLGMACIVGGGIGNIYDRIVHGSVTDFLHIDFRIFETGIFNLADVSIMLGAAFILLDLALAPAHTPSRN